MSPEVSSPLGPICLDHKQAAVFIGMSESWLKLQVRKGNGPPRLKLSGKVKFPIAELVTWMAQHLERTNNASSKPIDLSAT